MSPPQLNKQVIEKMMALTVLHYGTARRNMDEYELEHGNLKDIQPLDVLKGMKWNQRSINGKDEDILPSQVPIIFPTRSEREIFEYDLKKSIPAGVFGTDERRDI